ncbi:dendrin isoform X2 [Paroedura picta]|uniref:dendrin isoform X2 n=1 Tax=Paroedura picta TaxID=143630 RepID=UPI0040577543
MEPNGCSCTSSRSTMEAGPWTGKDCSAPWMYHRVAGQYTLWEKQLLSDFSPRQRRPSPRVLQDSTNWPAAQPPAPWAPLRHDGPWLPGKEGKRAAASPKPRSPRSPTYDALPAVCRREPPWRAKPPSEDAAAPDGSHGPLGAAGKLRGDLPARSPPSYEAHMRLRAGQAPRKENRPRPPPYVAPPSYEAAHRTAQPQRRPSRAAGAQGKAAPAEAPPARQAGPRTPSAGRKGGPGQVAAPGRWSCLVGARTWAGRRRQAGRAEASPGWAPAWPRTPPPRSHTLPRAAKRVSAACPPPDGSSPPHAFPAGWAFSRAAGLERRGSPEPKESRGRRREAGGSPPEGAGAAAARRAGGLLVIDATCVVIRTHYIPPARPERVRYVGRARAKPSPAAAAAEAAPPASPPAGSLEERASRILGLPVSELGFHEPEGPASPRRRAAGPERAASSPQGSPEAPRPRPAPESVPPEPPETGLVRLQAARAADAGQSPPGRSYVRDLRAAMSRIRRHTAPDSDTDEELEKERRPAGGPLPWSEAALAYSSSSSSESIGSNATVVPGNAHAATLSHGPQRGWLQPSQAVP